MNTKKQNLISALRSFVRQRSGMEPGNYNSYQSYNQERRRITKDLADATRLLDYVAARDSITADAIVEASRRAFSGRLKITPKGATGYSVDYCTGQYFPTEYRRAVCSVLSSAIWVWGRENAPVDAGFHEPTSNLRNLGDYLRRFGRQELGRGIAERYFS